MGDKPQYRLIKRKDDGSGWETIGAAWIREKGGYSVNLELVRGGPKIKCLLVPNEEKNSGGETTQKPAQPPTDLGDSIPF